MEKKPWWKRRWVWIVVVLILCVIWVRTHGSDTGAHTSTPTTPLSTPSATPGTPDSTSTPTTVPVPQTPARQAVVDAAATATRYLSSAALLPQADVVKFVSELVDPTQQATAVTELPKTGQALAAYWGYADVATANASANYDVETQKYRIDQLDETRASVALYVLSSWTTSDGLTVTSPGITIVDLQKSGGKWYFISAKQPAANQVPTLVEGLSTEQTADRYKPYLKGFEDYVQTPDTP